MSNPLGNVGTYLYDSYRHTSSNRQSLGSKKMSKRRDSGNPAFPVSGVKQVYKFDHVADEQARHGMAPQFGADATGGVVRKGAFEARRNAQIRKRKAQGY